MIFRFLLYFFILSSSLFGSVKKVVSLAPNITEILYYLNYEKNIVAVDKFSLKPKGAEIIGDLFSINYERLLKLKPDLVFITESQRETARKLKYLNIKYHVVKIKKLTDLNREIFKISKLLKIKYKEIPIALLLLISKADKNKKKVLIVIDRDSKDLKNIYVAGRDNFINDFLGFINLKNIIYSNGYPKINIETVINLNPDVIIDLSFKSDLKVWYVFKNLKAVKSKKIFKGSINLTVPSPYIFGRIEKLKKLIKNDGK